MAATIEVRALRRARILRTQTGSAPHLRNGPAEAKRGAHFCDVRDARQRVLHAPAPVLSPFEYPLAQLGRECPVLCQYARVLGEASLLQPRLPRVLSGLRSRAGPARWGPLAPDRTVKAPAVTVTCPARRPASCPRSPRTAGRAAR